MKFRTTISTILLTANLGFAADEPKHTIIPSGAIPVALTADGGVDLVEQVLNAAPQSILRKLTDPATFAEGVKEINRYFSKNVLNKPAKLRIKIEAAGPYSQGPNKYHIRATSAPVKWMGGEMGRLVWFYFNADNIPPAGRAKVGSEVVVSGIVRRCEVTDRTGFLKINFDLTNCTLEPR
jgi:hypothetical protein